MVKAIDAIFVPHEGEEEKINNFILRLNGIIVAAVNEAIREIETICGGNKYIIESKYHSIYILAGIIFSRCKIDVQSLTITETALNEQIRALCLDLKRHNDESWFIDEKRQLGFFNSKIKELVNLQQASDEIIF